MAILYLSGFARRVVKWSAAIILLLALILPVMIWYGKMRVEVAKQAVRTSERVAMHFGEEFRFLEDFTSYELKLFSEKARFRLASSVDTTDVTVDLRRGSIAIRPAL